MSTSPKITVTHLGPKGLRSIHAQLENDKDLQLKYSNLMLLISGLKRSRHQRKSYTNKTLKIYGSRNRACRDKSDILGFNGYTTASPSQSIPPRSSTYIGKAIKITKSPAANGIDFASRLDDRGTSFGNHCDEFEFGGLADIAIKKVELVNVAYEVLNHEGGNTISEAKRKEHSRAVHSSNSSSSDTLHMITLMMANFEPIRRNMLQMLKPMDIVALWTAIGLAITPFEKRTYLSWIREVFEGVNELRQLRSEGCTITVIGKDLNNFTQAIRAWKYRPGGLTLLVVIKRLGLNPQQHIDQRRSFLESISEKHCCTSGTSITPDRVRASSWKKETDSQIIVMFTARNTRIELDEFWTERLLVTQRHSEKSSIGSSRVGDGLHNHTWFTNLHTPDPSIIESPLSYNTLRGMVEVLRACREGDKLLLSSNKFEAWTYIKTKDRLVLSAREGSDSKSKEK
ncbi:uncharacterized protein RAG0_02911 [Rhynchosporium agropyri]|uniref:Uncharacterized protein n=1 Tax=Rhynchosporium agropyri TaxID=914238 RepID=A0A1E1K760_9HELO|nr:uncharacterized protein RAG0_02911 [Rhynchosporium agropyri]